MLVYGMLACCLLLICLKLATLMPKSRGYSNTRWRAELRRPNKTLDIQVASISHTGALTDNASLYVAFRRSSIYRRATSADENKQQSSKADDTQCGQRADHARNGVRHSGVCASELRCIVPCTVRLTEERVTATCTAPLLRGVYGKLLHLRHKVVVRKRLLLTAEQRVCS